MTNDSPRLRLGIVGIVGLSLFAALFARLWFLQVLAAPELKLAAEQNAVQIVKEPAPRGRILDRHGRPLVDNKAVNVVAIDRTRLEKDDRPELLARLSEILQEPVDVLTERLDDERVSPYRPVPIEEDVSEQAMVYLREHQADFPAVVARRVAVRTYPQGNLAAHVLGYVGEVNEDEIEADSGQYELGDLIGKAGIEQIYEKDLRGEDGVLEIEVDSEGNPIRVRDRTPPVQGNDVVLSLDIDVQRTAEVALAEGLRAAQGQRFEEGAFQVADAGSVVVLDAKEGTVTAMASFPTYNLPDLADGISNEEWAILNPTDADLAAPFLNRAIQGQYAPGSTWKLVVADAALRRGLIGPNFSLVDDGEFEVDDCSVRCVFKNAGSKSHGTVGVAKALAVSSDVFFYTLGSDFWIERGTYGETAIQDAARTLGFGTTTGTPLPDEKKGRVLTPESKEALHEERPDVYPDGGWYEGHNVLLAIGQGELAVTPVQLANSYATYANGGTRHSPNVALRIQDQDGTVVREISPRVAARVELPSHVIDPIRQGLAGVVSYGTAEAAFAGFPLSQYPIAGKTGTAQASPKQDTALFVAYGPDLGAHQHVVSVVMEQAGFGASSAAPVARQVFGTLSGLETGRVVEFVPLDGAGD